MATPTKQLWSKFGGKGFSAEHAKYAERATTDEQGNNLTLTVTNSQVTAIGGKLISAVAPAEMTGATASTDGASGLVPAPSAGDEEKLLTGDGNWTAFENDVFGTQLLDEHDQPVLDEESTPGNPIYVYDANSTDELLTGFAGKGFGASRAYADQDGNNIKSTYATKDALPSSMTGATAQSAGTSGLVPAPAAGDEGKFLKGDGTWTTISMTEQRVDILNKTTGLTEADFDTAWTNLENRHLVGVWLDDHLFMVTWKYIYVGNMQKRIIFTSIENGHWVEHTFGGIKYKYIAWYRGNTSLTSRDYDIIPEPVNHGGQFLKSNNATVEWGSIKQVPSSSATDEGKVLTVNSAGSPEWKAPRIPVVASTAQDDTISGTVLTSVVHPYTYKEITIDDTVTKLVIQLEDAVSGVLQEAAFQFTLGNSSVLDAFEVHRGAYVLPAIGADTFTTGKTYQGTVVNGLVTLAEFDAPSYI